MAAFWGCAHDLRHARAYLSDDAVGPSLRGYRGHESRVTTSAKSE